MISIVRRLLFVTCLLAIGPAQQCLSRSTSDTMGPLWIFTWGMNSIGVVLALWLVARTAVWKTWQGWLRVAVYVAAYTYGRMLFSATQDWWVDQNAGFRWPGLDYQDYARPAIDLVSIVMLTWLVIPVVVFLRIQLASPDELAPRERRFTMFGLIGFVTTVAVGMGMIQFLATEYAPETAYSYGSPSSVLWNWLTTNLPYKLSPLAAAVLVLWGLTKRWWMAPLVLGLAICVDALGTQLIAFIIEQTTGESKGGILGDSHSSRWLYVGGRTFTLWGAFAVARLLNVRPFFGGEKTDSE